jgi:hypothetical protein
MHLLNDEAYLIRSLRQDPARGNGPRNSLIVFGILPVAEEYDFVLNQRLVILHLIPDAPML